ncbi:LacI family DNA-binding transcriptional regulator [Sinorhizobium americanum]|uniref:LacI family transcriptional regulator n=1 Tax=Sinorhizobium americanum TaxID=194963 RepID=A0A4R2BNB6_9HYPH|nr:LacI family DNA-binding transcriptional regulator [Sinorhizobium americanum]APG84755.1 LacI family transcriptional regulator [Sinorhizobium americanum CCGM7]TCN28968.1 LacI family transcriptional regulator [Sinorhizobium americanum]
MLLTVTIKHVAKAAGVAVGTVSRVLAKNKTVNEEIRIRVEEAIQELGYQPNSLGRSLRLNKTDLIGLVIPDITNPFFAELAKHVEMLASSEGYSVLLANSHDDPAAEQQQVQALLGRLPRGLILVPVSESTIGDLVSGKNTVTVDRPLQGQTLVGVDNRRGGYLAADHLLSLGHRRIAYMSGPPTLDVARERREGFVGRIREFQQQHPSQPLAFQTVDGNFDYRAGEELGNRLLRQEHPPTAIATASDQQAIGLMRAAADVGLSIPNDLSIVGFDDIPLASLVLPRLTTIRQPLAEIARIALKAILSRSSTPHDCKLEPVLVERNSTRAWPGR